MKIPKYVKETIVQLSNNSKKGRELNKKLKEQLDKIGVDQDTPEFMWAFGYVEGDCSPKTLIDYLEEL